MTPRGAVATRARVLGDALSRSVWRWQLVLAVSVVVIAGVAALLTPTVFANWQFVAALLALVTITPIALAAPWESLGTYGVLGFIVLDIFAIWLLDIGSDAPVAFLWVFPVAWIATYYSVAMLIGALSMIGMLMLLRFTSEELTVDDAIGLIMMLITLGFVGTTIIMGSHRNKSTKRLLRAQATRIERALCRVTEQRVLTQRLLDSLDIGVAQVSPEGVLELHNRRFQTLYGFDSRAQFELARAVEYRERRGLPIPSSDTTIARAARGELFGDEIVWLFGFDGQWRALRASTRVIEDGQFAHDGLVLLVEDVSAVVDPSARHGATMRTISHELRNPLTAVLGHVDLLLERDDLAEPARRQAEIIERAGERMQTLIDRALAADGPTSDDGDVRFDLAEMLRSSVEAFAPAAEHAKLRFVLQLDDPLPHSGDMFRIRQVIDNVIGNAIKYSHRGGTIRIRSLRSADHISIEVADRGIGIAADDLPRIFDGEFRAQSARDNNVPGTGLGMRISRDIMVRGGGSLDVRSELGQGTTVTITFTDGAGGPHA